jgi:polyisoprenoid-binding protein YceI
MTTLAAGIPGYVAGAWDIDPGRTRIGFTARHLGVLKVRGHFGKFTAEIVTAEDPLQSSATATVDLTSVDTGDETRDKDLRSVNFLDVGDYPTMTYRSTGIRRHGEDFIVDGQLTVRGLTHPVTLKFDFTGFRPDPHGGTRVAFSAAGQIHRIDFGVCFDVPILGLASDTVHFKIDGEAVLREGKQPA